MEEYGSRLKEVVRMVNENYDVEGLCRALPSRVQKLVESKGDKLNK